MLESGNTLIVFLFLCTGLSIMGLTYGPIGTVLSEIFPTSVRYTGSALTFNLAGIFSVLLLHRLLQLNLLKHMVYMQLVIILQQHHFYH